MCEGKAPGRSTPLTPLGSVRHPGTGRLASLVFRGPARLARGTLAALLASLWCLRRPGWIERPAPFFPTRLGCVSGRRRWLAELATWVGLEGAACHRRRAADCSGSSLPGARRRRPTQALSGWCGERSAQRGIRERSERMAARRAERTSPGPRVEQPGASHTFEFFNFFPEVLRRSVPGRCPWLSQSLSAPDRVRGRGR